MSQVQKSLSECSSAFLRSASRRASLTIPSVSNLRVFDNVQIPDKIADQVQFTLNRTGDQIVDASIHHLQEEILEVIQLFPPERVSESIVVQIVDVPVPQIPTRVEPFIAP